MDYLSITDRLPLLRFHHSTPLSVFHQIKQSQTIKQVGKMRTFLISFNIITKKATDKQLYQPAKIL